MRASVIQQAKAQYKWHKHIPLIRFVGPRKTLWAQKAAELRQLEPASPSSVTAASSEVINFWELPQKYRPAPMTDAEMEAIESGGASLWNQ